MSLQTNPQLELAFDYVSATDKNIFLTGKAGTGKTTFLQRIRGEVVKRHAVVAPTGVAAINAGGMTIHSFFQLPFGPFLPGNSRDPARQRKFSREKIRLIQSLDLLIIDEISMVRADLLDGIDEVLRRYKDHYKPFGGVQLLMIGDLHQLPPVVKDEEWQLLREYYSTPYFFSSRALQQTDPVAIELKHIFRQSDDTFIALLNKVRNNQIDDEVLTTLNSRYIPNFQPEEDQAYITLTAHNASAQAINTQKLSEIAKPSRTFRAAITGDFPTHAYPTDELLEFKQGAQVMFIKNDLSREKRYYNGKIGRVTRIEGETIYVRCPDEEEEIPVGSVLWDNVRYALNEQTKEVVEEIVGTFTQYPLKLAWAITIHKSQGLTFERAIIDAQAAFAHGQVYVALSRCKSFEGIVLRSKIAHSSVRTDSTVQHYTEEADKNPPDETQLLQAKRAFQQAQILELFGFAALEKRLGQTRRILLENESSLQPQAYQQFQVLHGETESQILPVAEKFRYQLRGYFQDPGLPEEHAELQDRIRKASAWFAEKLGNDLLPVAKKIPVITDNKAVRKTAVESLANLQQEIFVKHACFTACQQAFSTLTYLRAKTNAALDFQAVQHTVKTTAGPADIFRDSPHPELLGRLLQWRAEFAEMQNIELFEVLLTKTLVEVARALPLDLVELRKIKGIGKGKSKQFGAEIVTLVHAYCVDKGLTTAPLVLMDPLPKPDTKALSLELFKAGKSIDEIAVERGFVPSTIEGHLAHFIGEGELSIFDLIEETDVRAIEAFFLERQTTASSEAKAHFGDRFSYGQIKMVLKYMELEKSDQHI